MTWSLSGSGKRDVVAENLRSADLSYVTDDAERATAERFRELLATEAAGAPGEDVSVSCSGSSTGGKASSVSCSFSSWTPERSEGGFVGLVFAMVLAVVALIAAAATGHAERLERLASAAQTTAPHELDRVSAFDHAAAAMAAESAHAPAEVLLALGYVESRYDATATRTTHGALICGPLGVATHDAEICNDLAELDEGYAAGARMLEAWSRTCRPSKSRGGWKSRDACALAGYGGGYHAIARGTSSYPGRVLRRARRLARLAQISPG